MVAVAYASLLALVVLLIAGCGDDDEALEMTGIEALRGCDAIWTDRARCKGLIGAAPI